MDKLIKVRRIIVVNDNGDKIPFKGKIKKEFNNREELEEYRIRLSNSLTKIHKEKRRIQFLSYEKRLYIIARRLKLNPILKTYDKKTLIRKCIQLVDMFGDVGYYVFIDEDPGISVKKYLETEDKRD